MNLYLIFIALLMLIGIKVYFKGFNPNFMSKKHTANVKGIFVLIIFYSHFVTYSTILMSKDFAMLNVRNWLYQLMVAPFLLYSGYGIYESIKKKNQEYVDSMPKNRILKVWLHMAFCVGLFILMDHYLGIKIDPKKAALAFTGWVDFENSNWYIFVILCLYAVSYMAFNIFKKDHKKAIGLITIISMIMVVFLELHKEEWWYNTILCYPLGLYVSYYKEGIENALMKSNKNYFFALVITIATLLVFKEYEKAGTVYYLIMAMAFSFTVVLLSMKINLNDKILEWFGNKLFWMYMLQRIPMIVLKNYSIATHPYRYAAACFGITIVMTIIADLIFKLIDSLLFRSKKQLPSEA